MDRTRFFLLALLALAWIAVPLRAQNTLPEDLPAPPAVLYTSPTLAPIAPPAAPSNNPMLERGYDLGPTNPMSEGAYELPPGTLLPADAQFEHGKPRKFVDA